MILASGRSRRINVNHLSGAYHPEHGLVWTDGQTLHLSVISVNHDDVTAAPPTVLGQFESVEHAAWSADSTPCYLSVQQTHSITVWKVDKCSEKLKFEKTNEVKKQAISRGCLWHPSQSLLVILCRDQLLLVDPEKASTNEIPLGSCHRVTAGTWSLDGSKVIVAAGLQVYVYELNSEKELVQSRTIQNFSGPIRTLVPVTSDLVAIALDLPLEHLVSQSQTDMFEAIPLAELRMKNAAGDSRLIQTSACSELEGKGHTVQAHSGPKDGDRNIKTEILQRSGPVDINALIRKRDGNQASGSKSDHQTIKESNHPQKHRTVLQSDDEMNKNTNEGGVGLPVGKSFLGEYVDGSVLNRNTLHSSCGTELEFPERSSEISDLPHLQLRPTGQGSGKLIFKRMSQSPTAESSRLVLVRLGSNDSNVQENAKDCILSAVELPCILNPDLLIYQERSQILVVGSNSQTKCYQVSVLDRNSLGRQRHLDLNFSEKERALGLCTLPFHKDLLLLTGDSSRDQDVTFLPSSSFSEYRLKLRTLKLNCAMPNMDENSDLENTSDLRTLTLPNGGLLTEVTSSQSNWPRKVEEVTVDT